MPRQSTKPDTASNPLSTLGQWALKYAKAGLPVFPLQPRSKEPFAKTNGHHDATLNAKQIRAWWTKTPDANIGLVPTKGKAIVDVDPKNGGVKTLKLLIADKPDVKQALKNTLQSKTGGGGWHYVFDNAPEELPGKLGKGIDLKRHGKGYIVAPPSIHPNGNAYGWTQEFDKGLILNWPAALAPAVSERQEQKDDHDPLSENQLVWLLERIPADLPYDDWVAVGQCLKYALGQRGFKLFDEWSATCEAKYPGIDKIKEKWTSFKGSGRKTGTLIELAGGIPPKPDAADEFGSTTKKPKVNGAELLFTSVTDIRLRKKRWIWQDRIPERALTLLAGEGGVGKGFSTVQIVNVLTNGLAWPDDPFEVPVEAGYVLWFCAEDDPESELKPRLIAAGVNMDRVLLYTGRSAKGKEDESFSLQDDLNDLNAYVEHLKAKGIIVRLVVFDPITAYVHGRTGKAVDSHNATQLRAILKPVSAFSHKQNLAVLGITHFAKDAGRKMIHRVISSQAWTATARMVLFAVEIPAELKSEQQQNSGEKEFCLMIGKVNVAKGTVPVIRYRIEDREIDNPAPQGPDDKVIETAVLEWLGVDHEITEEDLIGKSSRGPVAVKQRNLEQRVREIFDAQSGDELPARHVLKELTADGFGTATRLGKDLAKVDYLAKRKRADGWHWKLKRTTTESLDS